MKNRSLVLTVSLIAMMIVGVAHGAQIASTDYVTKSVGDEADLVWTAIDSINNETTGVLATAKSYTDTEITAAMEEVADAIPTDNAQLANGAGYITSADIPTVDDALSSTSTNAVQNKVVTAALDGKLGKNEKAASAATADSATTAGTATSATQDASGNVITETYATKTELSSGLSGKLDTNGSIEIAQVTGLSDALAQAGSQLNEAQTAAVNSGITQAKVEAYDAYADQIASKADASAIPTDNAQLTNGAGYITAEDIPDVPTVDDALSSTSTNAVQNKVVTAALDGKLGKNEKAASATTADSATTAGSATKATQDASGNVITETYALKTAIPTNNNQLTNGAGYITAASLPTKVSELTNDTGFITADQDKDTVYTLPAATAETLGGVKVDTAISSTSTNPVQNKAVSAALSGKMDKVTLATVATSGNYSDLSGLPTIPGAATASVAGIMKWGQIPSGSETATTSATIWVQ